MHVASIAVHRQVLSIVNLWYHVSGNRPIKLPTVRDRTGQLRDDFLLFTDPAADET